MNVSSLLDQISLDRLPAVRAAAAAQFRASGWPDRRSEAWHYTDLNARLRTFDLVRPGQPGDVSSMMPETSLPCVVFENGKFAPARSGPMVFATLFRGEETRHSGSVLPMVALNTAIAEDGAVITVPKDVDGGTMFLVSLTDMIEPGVIALRHRITVEAGGALTLIEMSRGRGTYLHDQVIEVELAAGAIFRHYRLQDEAEDAVHVTTTFAELASDSNFSSFILNRGARLSRNELHATLAGERATVHLNAAQLLAGSQHGDITTVVAHDAPNCASRQTVKSVLAGSSRGVFQGRIEVARAAQKTDGYQMNQALLLSPEAEINIKPELQIFADDVKCSHGATIGALDPEQIFYLRSRGIPEVQARALLIRAFIDDALEPVTDEAARAIFESSIEAWWQKGAV